MKPLQIGILVIVVIIIVGIIIRSKSSSSAPTLFTISNGWAQFPGYDSGGNDVTNLASTSLAACQSLAISTPNVNAYSYDSVGQKCWLKNKPIMTSGFGIGQSTGFTFSYKLPSTTPPANSNSWTVYPNTAMHGGDYIWISGGPATQALCFSTAQALPGSIGAAWQANGSTCYIKNVPQSTNPDNTIQLIY